MKMDYYGCLNVIEFIFNRVLLKMWDEIAEMSRNHVKPNDFVYVRGHLGSYVKADGNGDPRRCYEVEILVFGCNNGIWHLI